jgi:heat-inducible transcriptional repressor
VERYIAEGQPVGSRALSRYSGLDLSPASMRNVMADLEDLGFIASPHTSAGRIPTPRGYRFFVDTLLTIRPLETSEISQLECQLHAENRQRLVASASQVLSDLTRFAGVVMSPRRSPVFRHIEFLKLSDKRVLLILVTPDGDVQNRILLTERAYSAAELVEAATILNQKYAGLTFDETRKRIHEELKQLRAGHDRSHDPALDAGSEAVSESGRGCRDLRRGPPARRTGPVFGHAAPAQALRAVRTQDGAAAAARHFDSRAHGVQIFIGGESGLVPLDECSVVTAPYEVDGQVVGTVGVIGPDAHGLRARDPDRRHHRQAALQRHVHALTMGLLHSPTAPSAAARSPFRRVPRPGERILTVQSDARTATRTGVLLINLGTPQRSDRAGGALLSESVPLRSEGRRNPPSGVASRSVALRAAYPAA